MTRRMSPGMTWLLSAAAVLPVDRVHAQPVSEPVPEQPSQPAPPADTETEEGEQGALPDYSGDWRTREYLSGAWGGEGRGAGWRKRGSPSTSAGRRSARAS